MGTLSQFDLTTAFLGIPKTLAYGSVRGSGNLIFQQLLSDNSVVLFYLLGEGPWDSLARLWLNDADHDVTDTTVVAFHPGIDGEIGHGMTPDSSGGDNHVDSFWALAPGGLGLTPTTFSRYAYLGLHVPATIGLGGTPTVLADYTAMKCRTFDSSGNQTGFAWTNNPAWWICDFLIRKFILREAKVNQPLLAAELARFDWPSFVAAAAYFDADIGGGISRFSDGGVVFAGGGLTADRVLEQMLLMCRSYMLERSGIISLYADAPRSSVFTFTSDNIQPKSFVPLKSSLRSVQNRIDATWREMALASGSTDNGTRFQLAASTFDHEAHQLQLGSRGPGMAAMPVVQEVQLDYGNNTAERVTRLARFGLLRQLGDDVDINATYVAPFTAQWVGREDSAAIKPGDVITVDRSISEEFGGSLIEITEIEVRPDGSRGFSGLQYNPDAFVDTSVVSQTTAAPVPGDGLDPPFVLDGSNELVVPLDQTIDAGNRYAPVTGINLPTDLPYNGGFEIFADTQNAADGWTPDFATVAGATYSRSSSPYSGVYAQSIAGGTLGGTIASRPFGVTPGTTCSLGARVKANAPNVGDLYIRAIFFSDDSDFSYAGWIAQGTMYADVAAHYTANATTWTPWSNNIIVPAGAKFCRIVLYNWTGGAPGILTFDTVTWRIVQVLQVTATVGATSFPTFPDVGAYVVIPEMSETIETYGGKVMLEFSGTFGVVSVGSPPNLLLAFFCDGVQIGPQRQIPFSSGWLPISMSYVDSPSPGSHTYDVRCAPYPGSGGDYNMFDVDRTFQAVEV